MNTHFKAIHEQYVFWLETLGFESKKEIEMLNSDINVANTRITNNNENSKRYEEEIKELNTKIEELQEEIKQKQEKKNNLRTNKEKFEEELKAKEEELEKISSKLSKKELEIEEHKKVVDEDTDKKYELQSLISAENVKAECGDPETDGCRDARLYAGDLLG